MIMRWSLVLAVLVIVASVASAQQTKPSSLLDFPEFAKDWQISRQFTLDVADAMPAEFYNFRPNADEMTFGEQIVHIAGSNVYRFHQISGIKPPLEFDTNKRPPTDKDSAMKFLALSFDYVLSVLPQITTDQLAHSFTVDWKGRSQADGRTMLMNMFVHTAHHRAQCEVYLRAKGIKPPDYTF